MKKKSKKSIKKKVILAVGAHPDDIDFGASGTIAKLIKEGAEAYYVICTNGNKGFRDPRIIPEALSQIRTKEQLGAAKILGVKEVFFLDHEDTELENNLELREEITRIIRKVRPDIVFTIDPLMIYSAKRGYLNHSDHRVCGQAVLDAIYPLARDPLTFPHLLKEGLKPHKVKEIYLTNFDEQDMFFDISSTMNLKLRALSKHKSQVSKKILKRIKERARQLGKENSFPFAEGFKRIILKF